MRAESTTAISTAGRMRRVIRVGAPDWPICNLLIQLPRFIRSQGRLPRRPGRTDATLQDFHFLRATCGRWTARHCAFVDKETAKSEVARLVPELSIARTVEVIDAATIASPEDLERRLAPYRGQHLVAKPTHASGCVLRLDSGTDLPGLVRLYHFAVASYFPEHRERYYRPLKCKVLVEENIGPAEGLLDYKFHCSYGKALFCHLERNGGDALRASYVDLEFRPIDVPLKGLAPVEPTAKPQSWDAMLAVAARLSEEFDFVRVDLYDVGGKPYFGELTFAPAAGCGRTPPEYSTTMLRGVKQRLSEIGAVKPRLDISVAGF
jgi:hypothetical protein